MLDELWGRSSVFAWLVLQNSMVLSAAIFFSLIGLIIYLHFVKIDQESLLVIGSLGIQVTSSYASGKESTTFIEMGRVKDVVINEAIHMVIRHSLSSCVSVGTLTSGIFSWAWFSRAIEHSAIRSFVSAFSPFICSLIFGEHKPKKGPQKAKSVPQIMPLTQLVSLVLRVVMFLQTLMPDSVSSQDGEKKLDHTRNDFSSYWGFLQSSGTKADLIHPVHECSFQVKNLIQKPHR